MRSITPERVTNLDAFSDPAARPHSEKMCAASAGVLAASCPRPEEFGALVAGRASGNEFGNEQIDGWPGLGHGEAS
jgi:hypothetical protein